ncbi:MAG: methylenetetrahydrofolate reductase, partial [Pseudomonadota bacterium]
MALLNFRRPAASEAAKSADATPELEAFLQDYSIEVMPRTAEKIDDFQALLPAGTRVYIAHIDGTEISDMVATAKRLAEDGFQVMPHFPARSIRDRAMLEDWVARYKGEANVT